MLILLSPAKKLDFETPIPIKKTTTADFLMESEKLIKELKKLSPTKIGELMSVSEQIATLNYNRFQNWNIPFDSTKARAAMYAFNGEAYTGLDAYSMNDKELQHAEQHFRILSGLYGLLKPLDAILPYRLEMGTKFKNGKNKNLYEFWGNKITQEVNKSLEAQGDDVLVNLASIEYFKSIKIDKIKGTIITPMFKEFKNGAYQTIMVFAKKARGLMTRYIISNNIKQIEDLKGFSVDGYEYNDHLSEGNNFVFTRG